MHGDVSVPSLSRWNTTRLGLFEIGTKKALIKATSFAQVAQKVSQRQTHETIGLWDKKPQTALVCSGLLQRPALITKVPPRKATPKMREAAFEFDQRHRAAISQAEDSLRAAFGSEPTMINDRVRAFNANLVNVRRNRFFEPEHMQAVQAVQVEERKIETIRVERKIETVLTWHPRMSLFGGRAIGKDPMSMAGFHDAEDKLRACLELDWSIAVEQHNTRKFIVEFGGNVQNAVDSVFDVLWDNAFFVYACYDFYATHSKSDDVVHIRNPAYKRIIADTGLETQEEGCKSTDFQALWKLLTSGAEDSTLLNREQWLQCLVRFAGMKYRNTGTSTLADALVSLFSNDFHPKVDRRTLVDIQAFRNLFVYVQDIDTILKAWERTLRNIFNHYAFGDGAVGGDSSTELLGYEEWRDLLIDLELYGQDLTHREVALSFVWSRMRIVDERKSAARVQQLNFDEFLEALIRVAAFKAIPLDEEVYDAGCEDAGELMIRRQSLPPAQQAKLIEANMRDWDDPLPQPMSSLLEGLLSYVIRVMERAVYGDNCTKYDGKISLNEVKKFKESVQPKRDARRKALAPFMATIATEAAGKVRELSHDEQLRASLFGTVSGLKREAPQAEV